jgi:PAS domain S-box-containing protein
MSSRERGRAHAEVTPAAVAASLAPRILLEALPECLLVVDAEGRILYANLSAESLTGFTRQELTGKAAELLIATELRVDVPLAEAESVCRRADGSQVQVTVTVTPIQDQGPAAALILLRDTADQRAGHQARFEAEAKYRALVEQIPGVVYLDPVDEEGTSIYVSPQVERLFGVTPSTRSTSGGPGRRTWRPTARTRRSSTSIGSCTRTAACAGSWSSRTRSTTNRDARG